METIKKYKVLINVAVIFIGLIIFGLITNIGVSLTKDGIPLGFGGRTASGPESTLAYVTEVVDGLIYTGPVILERIIVGNTVTSSAIQVSDDTASASVDVIFYLSGTDLQGVWDIGAALTDGIVATVSGLLDTTFIYSPK